MLQLASNDDLRGSVFAALGLVMALGQATGLLIAGALQEKIGTLPRLEPTGRYVPTRCEPRLPAAQIATCRRNMNIAPKP
jgi:hypothetical protein